MGRPRSFDHEECLRRYEAGWTVRELATAFDVAEPSIRAVTHPATLAYRQRYYEEHFASVCSNCGERCVSRHHPAKRSRAHSERELCFQCANLERTERLRNATDGTLVEVRCNNLDCANGERWQAPGDVSPREGKPLG